MSEERQRLLAAHFMQGGTVRGATVLFETNIPTVLRNMLWLADACQRFHDEHVRNLKCTFVECDELTSIIHAKDENLPEGMKGLPQFGDMWTYVSICADSRLVINWRIGKHQNSDVVPFVDDLASRIPGKVQIHTDQLALYRPAFENSFGSRADYATTRKTMDGPVVGPDGQYVQPDLKEARIRSEFGDPDLEEVTTNHVERQNATLRGWNRTYTRRTLAFSKKLKNAGARLAINYFYYNFVHQHDALDGITPAMAAGVTDRLWSIRDAVKRVATSG